MAFRALSTAASGGRALMTRIDTIANNLANVNTPAYKRVRANFSDMLAQRMRPGSPDVSVGTGVRLVSTEKLFGQGALTRTDRLLDVAVEGNGFLRVRTPDGGVAYTRNGKLSLDPDGRLLAGGHPLDPPVEIPSGVSRLVIDPDGAVRGLDPEHPEGLRALGVIRLTNFINPSALEAHGDHLYLRTAAAGEPVDGRPGGAGGFGLLRQGHLEDSNVDVIRELVDLVAAQRAFEINARAIEAVDEMLKSINGTRG